MDELAELQAQHTAGHGPLGICGGPERCTSVRYLAIIERLVGERARVAEAREKLERAKYRIEGDNPLWHSKTCACCIARRALDFALAALVAERAAGRR